MLSHPEPRCRAAQAFKNIPLATASPASSGLTSSRSHGRPAYRCRHRDDGQSGTGAQSTGNCKVKGMAHYLHPRYAGSHSNQNNNNDVSQAMNEYFDNPESTSVSYALYNYSKLSNSTPLVHMG